MTLFRTAILALISMIICPIFSLFSTLILFAVLTWIACPIVFSIEFPIFIKCFRKDSHMEKVLKGAQKPLVRALVYAVYHVLFIL